MFFELDKNFRYVHEPLIHNDTAIPLLGHQTCVEQLKERILYSTGGSFLVTGFRGVGKTTVVRRAVNELIIENNKNKIFIPLYLSIAKSLDSKQLMFEIIRRLFEALLDFHVLDKIDQNTANAITLSYARTSLSFKQTKGKTTESTVSASLGSDLKVGASSLISSLLKAVTPKISSSRKTTNSLALESSFLAYTDMDVEHDFLRIVALLKKAKKAPSTIWRRIWSIFSKRKIDDNEIKLIIVLDELDKLTGGENGHKAFDLLLNDLKNVLTTRGVSFIFSGGVDLHDKWLRDVSRGNSVYESIFAWQLYIPCVWNSAGTLIEKLFDIKSNSDEVATEIEAIKNFLNFKGRGIPRRLLQDFNSFIKWKSIDAELADEMPKNNENPKLPIPYFVVEGIDIERIQFYSDLHSIIISFNTNDKNKFPTLLVIDKDRLTLGIYYIMDCILKTQGSTFSINELIGADGSNILDPTIAVNKNYLKRFCDYLVTKKILLNVRGGF